MYFSVATRRASDDTDFLSDGSNVQKRKCIRFKCNLDMLLRERGGGNQMYQVNTNNGISGSCCSE